MKYYKIEFGFLARRMSQQLPFLPIEIAEAFDADNAAISRARVRGYITDAELTKIHRRLAAAIGDAIASPTEADQ